MNMQIEGSDVVFANIDHGSVDMIAQIAKQIEPSCFTMFVNGNLKVYFTTVTAAKTLYGMLNRKYDLFVSGLSIHIEPVGENCVASCGIHVFRANSDAVALAGLIVAMSVEEARTDTAYWLCRGNDGALYARVTSLGSASPIDYVCRLSKQQYDGVVR